ncbi:hypothetical protein V3C99_016919 [Haemonchus contortus]
MTLTACSFCFHRTSLLSEASKQESHGVEKDYTLFALILSAFSFVVYNALFLAAQLWEAVGTLALGLYYIVPFWGYARGNTTVLRIGTGLQALATAIIFGFFVFFCVEIFVPHSLVYKVLTYIIHMDEDRRVKVARYTSIGMTVDSLVTSLLHLWALVMCFLQCRQEDIKSDAPLEAMAIHTELDYPQVTRLVPQHPPPREMHYPRPSASEVIMAQLGKKRFALPRLRTTSDGEIVGTLRSKARLDHHHLSMPPPTRF